MTRIDWKNLGMRFYETGVDRGVLYVGTGPGVPWTGLVSVTEKPSGGDAKPFYLDGIKYLNLPAQEEYEATIEAFTYPDEFGMCDGTVQIRPGLFATQQNKLPFNLSYRTKIGNDTAGPDFAYRIHLVYNCLVKPTDKAHKTFSGNSDLDAFSWDITTTAPIMGGVRNTAHIIIDSRTTNDVALGDIENILYGSDTGTPRMPNLDEIILLFDESGNLDVVDNGDGSYTITAPSSVLTMISTDEFQVSWPTITIIDSDRYLIGS